MMILYGIKNCDTVKKACQWLSLQQIDYRFHDFRKDGLEEMLLQQWLTQVSWEDLLNKKGTTWRQLPEAQKQTINEASAITLMLEKPAIIKRPIVVLGKHLYIGFSIQSYQENFKAGQHYV